MIPRFQDRAGARFCFSWLSLVLFGCEPPVEPRPSADAVPQAKKEAAISVLRMRFLGPTDRALPPLFVARTDQAIADRVAKLAKDDPHAAVVMRLVVPADVFGCMIQAAHAVRQPDKKAQEPPFEVTAWNGESWTARLAKPAAQKFLRAAMECARSLGEEDRDLVGQFISLVDQSPDPAK